MTVEQVERLRVAWVDTDAGGRIHFTAVVRWTEAVETALMRKLGLLDGWGKYPRRHVVAEYRKVLRFEDEIELRLRVGSVDRTSVTYEWEIRKDADVYADGRYTVVHVDAEGQPGPLPERIRAALGG